MLFNIDSMNRECIIIVLSPLSINGCNRQNELDDDSIQGRFCKGSNNNRDHRATEEERRTKPRNNMENDSDIFFSAPDAWNRTNNVECVGRAFFSRTEDNKKIEILFPS